MNGFVFKEYQKNPNIVVGDHRIDDFRYCSKIEKWCVLI
jgi:hypothetical protein